MIYAVGALALINLVLIGLLVRQSKATARAQERERQATVDADLMEASEDVAQMAGPTGDNLGDFWDGMRDGE